MQNLLSQYLLNNLQKYLNDNGLIEFGFQIGTIFFSIIFSVSNLALLYYIFKKNNDYQLSKDVKESKSFWFRNFVLSNNINDIHAHFYEIKNQILPNIGKDQDEILECLNTYQELTTAFISKIGDPLSIIFNNAYTELNTIFQNSEDVISEYLILSINKNGKELYEIQTQVKQQLESDKIEFLKYLYKQETRIS